MQRLAEEPIGKKTTATPAEVAKMLTALPKRAAFVRSADTVGVIYTHDTIPPPPRRPLYEQIVQVLNHTRAVYCRPREEVERSFLPVDAQLQAPIHPVNRWEEIE